MLPVVTNLEELKTFDLRQDVFLAAARALLARQGLVSQASASLSFPTSGSLPVVLIGEGAAATALKFFPAILAEDCEREASALLFLATQPGLAPRLLDAGSFEGWHYVLMSRLAGQSLKAMWEQMTESVRLKACRQVGLHLRALHRLPVEPQAGRLNAWKSFLKTQTDGCYARHEKIGLSEDLLRQIPDFLKSVTFADQSPCFLHTEVMRDHVFFSEHEGHLSFEGFIDFEPSMTGAAEYDLASVGVFLTSGDRAALMAFYEGYGCVDRLSDPQFKRRVMAYLLLHKYSNLKWYLQFMPNAPSLDQLAELWW